MIEGKSAKATKEIALTAVLSAAYAAAIMFLMVPSPTGGYTQIGDLVVLPQHCSLDTELEVPSA